MIFAASLATAGVLLTMRSTSFKAFSTWLFTADESTGRMAFERRVWFELAGLFELLHHAEREGHGRWYAAREQRDVTLGVRLHLFDGRRERFVKLRKPSRSKLDPAAFQGGQRLVDEQLSRIHAALCQPEQPLRPGPVFVAYLSTAARLTSDTPSTPKIRSSACLSPGSAANCASKSRSSMRHVKTAA